MLNEGFGRINDLYIELKKRFEHKNKNTVTVVRNMTYERVEATIMRTQGSRVIQIDLPGVGPCVVEIDGSLRKSGKTIPWKLLPSDMYR